MVQDGALSQLRRSVPQRLRAAGIHFALSAVVFAVTVYLILAHWYPDFHFTVDGGWQGLRIMAGVDLVLGPALTLIIFNPFKARRLIAFDLACIGVTQVAALVWGFYAIHSQRPVAISHRDGEFFAVAAEPLKIERYPLEKLRELSDRHPALVYSRPPAEGDESTRAAMQELVGGVAAHEDPFFFEKFAPNWPLVSRKGKAAGDRLLFPYNGRYGTCQLAFTQDGELIEARDCEPL
jgi:hypothetical protein